MLKQLFATAAARVAAAPRAAAPMRAASAALRPAARPIRPLARMYSTPAGEEAAKKEVRDLRNQTGRFSSLAYRSLALMLATGAAIYMYFDLEKEKAKQAIAARDADQSVGKPKLGGPFTLADEQGAPITDAAFRGKFMLVYFGFTNCPDICPEELEKMAEALDSLAPNDQLKVVPVFISVDPKRDDVAAVREYVKEFHPRLRGLTGTYPQVKATAKQYRVYFSSPPPEEECDDDYLVDHSIFMYLMDPAGQFVDAYGKNLTVQQMVDRTNKHIGDWEAQNGKVRV
ncbi:Cu-binding protein [Blastocladiella emersonii ATCC 22665]|nr:Cu-binding protein [Blastocladiella emersonii ATCC 22665]